MAGSVQVGDVVVVELARHQPPGHEQEGYRPAVVVGLAEALGTPRFPVAVLAPLTTQRGPWAAASPELYPQLPETAGGLPRALTVLLDNIRAVDASRVVRRLGTLTLDEFAPIRRGLRTLLQLYEAPTASQHTPPD